MDPLKKDKLNQAGWATGDANEFLELTPEESEFVELKLSLATGIREVRISRGLTQSQLARKLGSSQSRIAKMEAADTSVSLDLMFKSFFKMGAHRKDVARYVSANEPRRRKSVADPKRALTR